MSFFSGFVSELEKLAKPRELGLVSLEPASASGSWSIHSDGKRVGKVSIRGKTPSINIHVNADQRGQRIGERAYKLALNKSKHNTVYAHMRKGNIASRRAAEKAGFKVVDDKRQLTMRWDRGS